MLQVKSRLLLISLLVNHVGALSAASPPTSASSATDPIPSLQLSAQGMVLKTMQNIHDDEIRRGKDAFEESLAEESAASTTHQAVERKIWNDFDFLARNIGLGNTGTDATYLQTGDTVFESQQPVLTEEECQAIIDEARTIIDQELQSANNDDDSPDNSEQQQTRARTNSQLSEAALSNMPKARQWLQRTLSNRLLPLLESRFGVSNLVLYDGLVLNAQAPSRSQPIHRDASLLTLNIALSSLDDFDGGGTYVEALDTTLKIERGHLLCHAGGAMHAGVGISRGERWVLVLFVLATNEPQMARRCHAQALECLQNEQLGQADTILQVGLEIAPRDHLLHNTMGRLHMMRHQKRAAFQSFQKADQAYPICQKAMVSMAQLLLEQRRPRASLRRFNAVLERINNRDLQPEAMLSLKSLAWAARKDAARCALLCAEHNAKQSVEKRHWTVEHLPLAIERLNTCLIAAPGDPQSRGMLDRAEFLLAETKGK